MCGEEVDHQVVMVLPRIGVGDGVGEGVAIADGAARVGVEHKITGYGGGFTTNVDCELPGAKKDDGK